MSLYLFDIDGTLIRSFMREGGQAEDYGLVEVLPKRRSALDALRAAGHSVALVTNQGGVAFGYQTKGEVAHKLGRVLTALGLPGEARCIAGRPRRRPPPSLYVSLVHPKAKDPAYRCDAGDDWRKPGGGMIRQAMRDHSAWPEATKFIGDMDSDRLAAGATGVRYQDAGEFFEHA